MDGKVGIAERQQQGLQQRQGRKSLERGKMWKQIVAAESFKFAHACKAHLLLAEIAKKRLSSDFWLKGLEWIVAGSVDQSPAKVGVNIDIQQNTGSKYTSL